MLVVFDSQPYTDVCIDATVPARLFMHYHDGYMAPVSRKLRKQDATGLHTEWTYDVTGDEHSTLALL